MVKRSTDYKQVYLVDSLYFRNCNQQNALSNNQHITLSTPKSNQFFNNHYHNPSSTSKECDCNNLQKQVHPSFLNPKEYVKSNTSLHLNNPKVEYDFKNKIDENDSQDEDTINPPDPFLYYDDNITNNEQQVKEDRNGKTISNTETFPYYDNYQNIAQQLHKPEEVNNNSTQNPKIVSKDILNKTKKQFYSCFICKQTFNSILLLEKHNMIKHKKYQNLNALDSNTNSDDVITEDSDNNDNNDNNEFINNNDNPDSPPKQSNNEVTNNDDEWIDIPDIQPNNSIDANSQLSIRKDLQTNFPNSNNIAKRKKQTDNIRKYYTYKCGECFRGFQNFDGLKEHQLKEHGKVGQMKRSITSNMQGIINEGQKIEEINSYWCSVCENFFQNFASLNEHLKKEHHNAPLRAKRSRMNDKIKRKKVLYYTKY